MLSVHQPIGKRRADFVVEDKVLVELKAITEFSHARWAQVLNYLRAYRLEVGLLLNFGTKSMPRAASESTLIPRFRVHENRPRAHTRATYECRLSRPSVDVLCRLLCRR